MRGEDLTSRLVVKRYANGRCIYDEAAKRELIEACLAPGASVAKLAREHAVNANLLHTWISQYRKEGKSLLLRAPLGPADGLAPAFIPVITPPLPAAPEPRELRLDITLDNGTQADLRCLSRDDVLAILPVLANLPCSASTRR